MTVSITTQQELDKLIAERITSVDIPGVTIFAGHFPMTYNVHERSARFDMSRWGIFSIHSFELGCRAARIALDAGKSVRMLVVCDDLIEIPKDEAGHRHTKHWMMRAARRVYRTHGLPLAYQNIARTYGVLHSIVSQQRSFGLCPVISEQMLTFDALKNGKIASNECSLVYAHMIDSHAYMSVDRDHLISFVPGQCRGNICSGVLDVRNDITSTHIFFPHIEQLGGILDIGNGFESCGSPLSEQELYRKGRISLHTTTRV